MSEQKIRLDIRVDGDEQDAQSFDTDSVTIGKGVAATCRIDDDSIADLQAVLQIADSGMTLLDLVSDGGLKVNGEPLSPGPQAISFGDVVEFGKTRLDLADPNAVDDVEDEAEQDDSGEALGAFAGAAAAAAPDAFASIDSVEEAYIERGEAALDFLMRSGTADSDMGVDRKAAPVLEVATVWNDTVTEIKHFDRGRASVTIGDELTRPAFSLDKVLDLAYGAFFVVTLVPEVAELINARVQKADFFLDSADLPGGKEFSLVQGDGKQWFVRFSPSFKGYLENEETKERTSIKDLVGNGRAVKDGDVYKVALQPDERAVIDVGHVLFFVHEVHRAKVAPVPWLAGLDVLFSGIMAILALAAAVLMLFLSTIEWDPNAQIEKIPERFVDMMIQEPEKPKEKQKDPNNNPDAGEGAKAKEEEGKVGRKEAKLKKAKGAKVAVNKAKMDKEIAQSAGLLADLNTMSDSQLYGTGGLDAAVTSALGGLSGVIGTQYGSGGLGSRGSGLGGGGTAEGLGGMGTKGRGSGASGYGKGAGYYGKKGTGEPGVGSGDPIVLGALDKSIIDRVVKQHLSEIRYCYQKELNKNPKLSGKLVVKFTIAADGTVSSAGVKSSSLNNKVTESCITGKFMRFRFPKPKGGGIVMVSYPFVFKSAG